MGNANRTVTVIVATYNPILRKALETLNSIILQTDISIQIIVVDDCSKDNFFSEYTEFFEKKGFSNYILLCSDINKGTIKNIERCANHCEGEYIKLLSPGDYLYHPHMLYEWVEHMCKMKVKISVSDAYFYRRTSEGCQLIQTYAFPQAPCVLNDKNERRKKYYQLIYNDYWLGAATLVEKSTFGKYIKIISDIGIYGEDNMYRIAACDGISRSFYRKDTILYEADTGISSRGEKGKKWHKILMGEWAKTNEYILQHINADSRFIKRFRYFSEWKKNNEDIRGTKLSDKNTTKLLKSLIPLYLHIPGMLFWNVRCHFFTRKTNVEISKELVNDILDIG